MLYNIIGNVPAVIESFTSTSGYGIVRLDWEYLVPDDLYITEIWSNTVDDYLNSTLLAKVYKTNFYIDIVPPGQSKYYWAWALSSCGKYSLETPYPGANGGLLGTSLYIIFLLPSFSTQTATSSTGAITQTRSKNLAVTFTSTPGFTRKEVDKLTGAVTFTSTPAATFLYSVNTTSTLLWDIQ